jgi:hypothetical protein
MDSISYRIKRRAKGAPRSQVPSNIIDATSVKLPSTTNNLGPRRSKTFLTYNLQKDLKKWLTLKIHPILVGDL